MTTRIKFRRDTSGNWADNNPILALGEPGIITNTNPVQLKIGDGETAWNSLHFAGGLPVGMVGTSWYGTPTLTNDLAANSDSNYLQLQTQTAWIGDGDYGRALLSWHDSDVSFYSHVQADPYGVSIRNAQWFDGYDTRYWEFQRDGRTRFPNGLVFDVWNDSNISNDYIKLYEYDPTGEKYGQYNAYVVQLQSYTKWWENEDYGRATLSWHDYNHSNYSHVHCDPQGVFIRNADWSGNRGGYLSYWSFLNDGTTRMPGALSLHPVNQTTSSGQTIEIDLTKSVNKLTPTGSGSTSNGVYHLGDGYEGQIMYLVSAGQEQSGNEYTGVNIDNARWGSGTSIFEGSRNYWLAFYDVAHGRTSMVTLIFTDGHWNIPHGSVD